MFIGGNAESLGGECERLRTCPSLAARTGSGVKNLFPGLFPVLPSQRHPRQTCPPPVCVRRHRLGAQDQPRWPWHRAVTAGEAGLGWGPAQGRGGAWGGCAAAGTSPLSWLCPEEMALGERRCHAHAERRADKGCAWEVCSVNRVGIFCLPHSQPLPPPAARGPLGSSQSRGSLTPFHPFRRPVVPFCCSAPSFCCSASPFRCSASPGGGRNWAVLHAVLYALLFKPKGRAFWMMSGKQLNR